MSWSGDPWKTPNHEGMSQGNLNESSETCVQSKKKSTKDMGIDEYIAEFEKNEAMLNARQPCLKEEETGLKEELADAQRQDHVVIEVLELGKVAGRQKKVALAPFAEREWRIDDDLWFQREQDYDSLSSAFRDVSSIEMGSDNNCLTESESLADEARLDKEIAELHNGTATECAMAVGLDAEVEKGRKAADKVIRANDGVDEKTMKELIRQGKAESFAIKKMKTGMKMEVKEVKQQMRMNKALKTKN